MLPGLVEGLTKIPMSWLMPVLAVHRSRFPLMSVVQLAAGVNVIERGVPVESVRSAQVPPSLFDNMNWLRLTAVCTFAVAGTSSTVSRVGEYAPPPAGQGPAPA